MVYNLCPLYALMSKARNLDVFSVLDPRIKSRLKDFGLTKPTLAQRSSIRPVIGGRDILLLAPTGTGKTEAVMLPLFHQVLKWPKIKGISVIYITPLRALNRDMLFRLGEWAGILDISIAVRHGDTSKAERARQSRKPPDVLITTPETLQILLTGKRLRRSLLDLRALVVDEIHELVESDRGLQLSICLERLEKLCGKPVQRIGLSATVGDPERVANYLGGENHKVDIVDAIEEKAISGRVVYPCVGKRDRKLARRHDINEPVAASLKYLDRTIAKNRATLIFVNTRDGAEFLGSHLDLVTDEPYGVHHGSLARDLRIELEDRFKAGDLRALISTSSLELGIDIGHVDTTVQYTSPRGVGRSLQRLGRSGHGVGRKSRGVLIAVGKDDVAECSAVVDAMHRGLLELSVIRRNALEVVANQVVAHIHSEKEGEGREIFEMIRGAYPFRDLKWGSYLEVLRTLSRNRLISIPDNEEYRALMEGEKLARIGLRGGRKRIDYFYSNISMIPDEGAYIGINIAGGNWVAKLDESFVIMDLEPGMDLTLGGKGWRVVDIKPYKDNGSGGGEGGKNGKKGVKAGGGGGKGGRTGEDVSGKGGIDNNGRVGGKGGKRKGSENILGIVLLESLGERSEPPHWAGEEIPVPFDIALAVGRLRRLAYQGRSDLEREMESVNKEGVKAFERYVGKARKKGLAIGDDRTIVIEGGKGMIIVNATFGHKVNTTLAHLLLPLVAERTGSVVSMNIDAYRAALFFDGVFNPKMLAEHLRSVSEGQVEETVVQGIMSSTRFKWILFHVAKKFGSIFKTRSELRIDSHRLMSLFQGTAVMATAIEKDMAMHMDLENTARVLRDIGEGGIEVLSTQEISNIGAEGLGKAMKVIMPEYADREILMGLKSRLEKNMVRLICMNCLASWRERVGEIDPRVKCIRCGAKVLTVVSIRDRDSLPLMKDFKKKGEEGLTKEERKAVKRLYKAANIARSDKKRAALALSARGVGPDVAARIIAKCQARTRYCSSGN